MECCFNYRGLCKILTIKDCSNCKFAKTQKEFAEANDKAIDRCRKLGICNKCAYSGKKCLKSTEI